MTGPDGGKITAKAYSGGIQTTKATGPMDWGDKCFLCSRSIGEGDPIGFYMGGADKTKMMRCHRNCLNEMEAAGGKPADYHNARQRHGAPPVQQPPEPKPPEEHHGAAWLAFESLEDYNDFTGKRGPIPKYTKVTIGGSVVQPGE